MTNHKWLFWILNLIWFQNNFQGVFWYLPFFFAVARYSSSFRSRWGHRILVCRSPRGENCSEEIKRSRIKSVCYHLETSTRETDLRLPRGPLRRQSPLRGCRYQQRFTRILLHNLSPGQKRFMGTKCEQEHWNICDSCRKILAIHSACAKKSLAGKCICLQLLK